MVQVKIFVDKDISNIERQVNAFLRSSELRYLDAEEVKIDLRVVDAGVSLMHYATVTYEKEI